MTYGDRTTDVSLINDSFVEMKADLDRKSGLRPGDRLMSIQLHDRGNMHWEVEIQFAGLSTEGEWVKHTASFYPNDILHIKTT